MLEPEAWSEVRLIHEAVLSLRVKMNGTTYTYRDICARWRGECYTNSILSFADLVACLRAGLDRSLLYTVQYCTVAIRPSSIPPSYREVWEARRCHPSSSF